MEMEGYSPSQIEHSGAKDLIVEIRENPTLPIFLKFEDVDFRIRSSSRNPMRFAILKRDPSELKHVLKGVTGSVDPGETLALMGPSGSGKTTLLKILGGRLSDGVTKGKITYNDAPYNPALKRRIGFVPQDDVLFPQLTVEETLVFAALLRLPNMMTRQQKLSRADAVIKELGLERCRDTVVGGGLVRGISGGERKRTSIGYEILVDPSLLLLDEPTSGLDSSSASKLLSILEQLAKAGRTIITTIHQPSSCLFSMFDKLLLISEGLPIYYGKAVESMKYFSSLGFVPEMAMNPAEFLLDLATGNVNSITIPESLQAFKHSQDFEMTVAEYLNTKYKTEVETIEKQNHYAVKTPKHLQQAIQGKNEKGMSWIEQYLVLSRRTMRSRRGDYLDRMKIAQSAGIAFLLGLLWWKSNMETEAQLRDQIGLLFYVCIFWTSSSLFGASYVFPFEKLYLVKERNADMYRLSVYYICSTLCDIFAYSSYPTIFMGILYPMAQLRKTASSFFNSLFAVQLIAFTSQGTGELLGAAVLSVKKAGLMSSLVLMLFLLTGGYYVQHLPTFMKWLKHVSFMSYGFRLLLKVQYSGTDLGYNCRGEGGCRKLQNSPALYGIDLDASTMHEIWVLFAMALAYRAIAFLCLRRRINGGLVLA